MFIIAGAFLFFKQIINASYTETPKRRFLCNASNDSPSSVLNRAILFEVSPRDTCSCAPASPKVFCKRCKTSVLLVLLECNSRQKSPMPSISKRFLTTDKAACFSATKSTLLFSFKALAMMLVIVCDLPVPGGPCKTKLLHFCDKAIALHCDASAGKGVKVDSGGQSSSFKLSSKPPPTKMELSSKASMILFLENSLMFWRKSFHIW